MQKILLTFLLFSSFIGNSQEVNSETFIVPLSNPEISGKLVVRQISGSIDVVGYDGKEVMIKTIFEKINSRDKGQIKNNPLTSNFLELNIRENQNTVEIFNNQTNFKTDLVIKVPVNFTLELRTVNNGNITVRGIQGEIEVNNVDGGIKMEDITGSVLANTTNGSIRVGFNKVAEGRYMAFSTFNGNIDITFPKTLKANLKMKSDMGKIFSDFELITEVDEKRSVQNDSINKKIRIEQWIRAKINGGGPEIFFKTYNGDIQIRSKQ